MILRFFRIVGITFRHIPRGLEPSNVREFFQDCGGAWVKLGQMLALRSDLLPEPIALELTQLFESLAPSEIEPEIAGLFATFDYQPIGVASFGQVHRAQLHDGTWVAVKIQKDISQAVNADLRLLNIFATIGDFLFSLPTPLTRIVDEFRKWTLQELDYLQEAHATETFQALKLSGVKTPSIVWSHTSKEILTETLVPGISLARILQGPEGYDTKYLAQKLIDTTLRQYYFHGFSHADPHAGNILVDEHHTLWYIDFGITSSATYEKRSGMAKFIVYALQGKYDLAIDAFLRLGFLNGILRDLHNLKHPKLQSYIENGIIAVKQRSAKRLQDIVETWRAALENPNAEFSEKSAAATFLKFISEVGKYRISLDPSLMLFIKTLVAVDAICIKLDPQFNLAKIVVDTLSHPDYAPLFAQEKIAHPEGKTELSSEKREQLRNYYIEWLTSLQ